MNTRPAKYKTNRYLSARAIDIARPTRATVETVLCITNILIISDMIAAPHFRRFLIEGRSIISSKHLARSVAAEFIDLTRSTAVAYAK